MHGDERWVEDHLSDFVLGSICSPHGLYAFFGQVVHRADPLRLLAVSIEGHHACVLIEEDVGLISHTREVAGVGRAAIDVGIVSCQVAAAPRCAGTAHELCAVSEHIRRSGHGCRRPVEAYDDGGQARATVEHTSHVGHLRRIELLKAKEVRALNAGEHTAHVGDILGREAVMIENGQ